MVSKRLALLLVAAFAIVFNFLLPQFASGQIPRPPSLQEMTQPNATAPEGALAGPEAQFIATTTQRVDRDHVGIQVYRNGKPVNLFPHFHELVTATPAGHPTGLDKLVGTAVTLVPSEKQAEQWDVYTGVGGAGGRSAGVPKLRASQWNIFTGVGGTGELVLADNIFKVHQVLLSSRKSPIEVHVAGQIHRLKPGQALLVL
jgi:hypothetical protein